MSTSTVKEAKQPEPKAKQPAKREAKQKKTVVYIGPSIRNVVSTGTIYNNGLPESLILKMNEQPVIKNLLVPVEGLADARKELTRPGSALRTIYDKVVTE